jgi:hypothetical protein
VQRRALVADGLVARPVAPSKVMTATVGSDPEPFHYPTEVVGGIRGFADRPAPDARMVACAYLAEVEPHLTFEALRFVAANLGINNQARFRADLVAQIRTCVHDGLIPPPYSGDHASGDLAPATGRS